jgi:hypothetical protein
LNGLGFVVGFVVSFDPKTHKTIADKGMVRAAGFEPATPTV